ncbi:ribose ABC transporter permease [Lachnoclostridium sp. An131]|uniref:ABC transporter permease n=1 Tax=Lachnoclostridium sp. An131 TaxID=1965555 RepID=UPI000B39D9BE|nr:ABC transporter permease [Lachnoclostridium sp. An131]OUQ26667.1 ribose ABC transporter permease [Lachnoclostridium sp. An131]
MSKIQNRERLRDGNGFKAVKNNLGIILSLLVLCILLTFATEHFLTTRNILNVLLQISTNGMIAFGMTYVILLGGIDLSVGSVVALSGTISMALMARSNWPLVPALLIGVVIGLAVGVINGLLITKVKMPAFIVTLAMMNITRGLALIMTSGKPIYVQDERLLIIGNGKFLDVIPLQIIYMLIIFLILFCVLNYTRYGKHLYATGGNIEAARFSGINVDSVRIIAYVISGVVSGIAGVMTAARLYSALPTMGEGAEMDAIAAVVLGGTMMTGGSGTLGGTLIGTLIIGVMNNGLNLLGVNSYWQDVAKGIIIIFAIVVDIIKNKKKQ